MPKKSSKKYTLAKIKVGALLMIISSIISSFIFVNISKAEEIFNLQSTFEVPGRIEGTGTHFEINNSEYLNITLESSEVVKVVLESMPEMVTINFESVSNSVSTKIILSGFAPRTVYHKYEDNYHHHELFATDDTGSYAYNQDLSRLHIIFIQPRPSTIFLSDSGWSNPDIGTWDPDTKTATLTQDLTETMQIDNNGITLDGNGHAIAGSGAGYGVYLYQKTGITIKNLNVKNFSTGIKVMFSNNNSFINNKILDYSGGGGIDLTFSSNNNISGNIISNHNYGIILTSNSDSNILERNIISNSYFGIIFESSNNNSISISTLLNNKYGIAFRNPFTAPSINNKTFNNNFINNDVQAVDYEGSNIFNLNTPIGGNYWSDFTAPDLNNDNFVDSPYIFQGGQDNLPWAKQDGWKTLQNKPPTLVSPGTTSDSGQIISTTTPTFSWNAVPGATRYGLYIDTYPYYPYGPTNPIYVNDNISGTSFTIPSGYLAIGFEYQWKVAAFDDNGQIGMTSSSLFLRVYDYTILYTQYDSRATPSIPMGTTYPISSLIPFTPDVTGYLNAADGGSSSGDPIYSYSMQTANGYWILYDETGTQILDYTDTGSMTGGAHIRNWQNHYLIQRGINYYLTAHNIEGGNGNNLGISANLTGNLLAVQLIGVSTQLSILDGSEFSNGKGVTDDPQKLVTDTTDMNGVVTDGVSRLLLRMEITDFSPVTFSLQGESNNPQDENGFLQSIDNQESQQKNQSLIVTPVAVGDKKYVFAIYRAPSDFVRHGIDKNQDWIDDDTIISERKITLDIKSSSSSFPEFTHDIILDRPPLLLIHGLWSWPKMWNSFETMLNGTVTKDDFFGLCIYSANDIWEDLIINGYIDEKGVIQDKFSQISDYSAMTLTLGTIMYYDPDGARERIYKILYQPLPEHKYKIDKLQVYRVDYSNKNSNYFDDNSDVPYSNSNGDNIQRIKEKYKKIDKIAITQVDILGHSTGGLLARIWAEKGNKIYKRNDNFWQGDIHKFITLDSPHSGSFLADLTTQTLKEASDELKIAIILACSAIKRDIINGAVYDLRTESGEITDMKAGSTNVLTHVIAGSYLVPEDNLDNIPGDTGKVLRLLRMWHYDPTSYVKESSSDLVVSLSSQFGGISPEATSKFGHQHTEATSQEVAGNVIDLINSDGGSSSFDNRSWNR